MTGMAMEEEVLRSQREAAMSLRHSVSREETSVVRLHL